MPEEGKGDSANLSKAARGSGLRRIETRGNQAFFLRNSSMNPALFFTSSSPEAL